MASATKHKRTYGALRTVSVSELRGGNSSRNKDYYDFVTIMR
jgi:hypothetical protein